jgi:glycerol-3-phosphate dehydrogenase
VAALAGLELRLRPAKGIHIVYDRRISNFALAAEAVDGRSLLMIPHGSFTLLGTTDDDFYGDPDAVEVLPDEVDYLLQAFRRVFPDIGCYRAVRATTGIRPTLFRWRPYEDDLSRRYEVIDHRQRDNVSNLVSVVGGKLSMFRLMAEETADLVALQLGLSPAPATSDVLPGSEEESTPPDELARSCGIPALAAAKLLTRHGCRAEQALAAASTRRLVCRCEPVLEAELVHAARHEQVSCLADAFRRVGLAHGPCAGARCVVRAAQVLGRELGWSPSQQQQAARDFVRDLWQGRAPVLDRWGWAQEELAYGASRGHRV